MNPSTILAYSGEIGDRFEFNLAPAIDFHELPAAARPEVAV
jgi:hypothetical protein